MSTIRSFRNADPAAILELWNLKARENPMVYTPSQMDILESQLFGNSLFDPNGFIVACHEHEIIGFIHATFGPNLEGNGADHAEGIIFSPVVHPSRVNDTGLFHDLIQAAESYLLGHDANHWFAGGLGPISPFYTGLYGRANPYGVYESEQEVLQAFENQGYQLFRRSRRFQLDVAAYRPRVTERLLQVHRRFVTRRNLYWSPQNWWDANIYRNFLSFEWNVFSRDDRVAIADPIAGAVVHQMLSSAHLIQNRYCMLSYVGVVCELLRQGIASVLFSSLVNDLQYESCVAMIMETLAFEEDERLIHFLLSQGFQERDCCQALCKIRDDFPADPDILDQKTSPVKAGETGPDTAGSIPKFPVS